MLTRGYLFAGGIAVLAGCEMFSRMVLGLGTPPLSIHHPQIEYMFKPNQSVLRFGNRVEYNQYGMRSEPFEPQPGTGECRIMVFGDSVINGGSLSSQEKLATGIWREELKRRHAGPVVVGNVSAGSWGPGNWLSYGRHYGFFGADMVVLVISTHDIYDNPEFSVLDPAIHPQSMPVLALIEGLTRYLPQYAALYLGTRPEAAPIPPPDQGASDLRTFLREARAAAPRVVVVQFLEKGELEAGPMPGHWLIHDIAAGEELAIVSSQSVFKEALASGGEQFRDNIHLTDAGQATLARLFATIQNPCGEHDAENENPANGRRSQ
jgi:hypothetical protein